MRGNVAFRRKVIYFAAIAVLLVPLYAISQPETTTEAGGWLAQLRSEHALSPGQIGEIDPTGASMNLATLGMRGVAANILWSKAIHYKRVEDFNNLKATVNQIAKLQPNFVSVWRFQAWELAYNVAAEFDDYRHRYAWAKKGVDYLKEGIRYNSREPMLYWELGWFFGHKLGRSDDRKQFRRMYREDSDFHDSLSSLLDMSLTEGPNNRPDNWKTSWQAHLSGQRIVDTQNVPIRGKSPLLYHSEPATALIYHAIALQKDGYLDRHGQEAWEQARIAFDEFGSRNLSTPLGYQIRLNDLFVYREDAKRWAARLDELVPGVRERLREEKRAALSKVERRALETPIADRTVAQMELADQVFEKIRVRHREVAESASPDVRREALIAGKKAVEMQAIADAIERQRETVNFDYWKTRCEAEMQDLAIKARKAIFTAEKLYDETDLTGARAKYEEAWDYWAEFYEKYPRLMEDPTAEDLVDSISRYAELLGQFEEEFPPPDFKLHKLLAYYDENYTMPPAEDESATRADDAQARIPSTGP